MYVIVREKINELFIKCKIELVERDLPFSVHFKFLQVNLHVPVDAQT